LLVAIEGIEEMEYRTLGRTGVRVSPLCLGAWQFGQRTPREEAFRLVDRAVGEGIDFFDTADIYGRGRSEEILGQALRQTGQRDRVVLATKFHGRMAEDDPNAAGNSRFHIIQACEASLRRLGTDHIDLYIFHSPQAEVPIDESLRALDDLVRAGKVRYIGTSNFSGWQMTEALWAAHALSLNRPVASQPAYNLLDRRAEREQIPMARSYGIAVTPWSPLAQGFLAGKYKRDGSGAGDARLRAGVSATDGDHFQDAAFDVVEMLEAMAAGKGCTVSQLALAWCIGQPGITSAIVGPRTVEQLIDNLGALKVTLSDADRQRIDAVSPPGDKIVHYHRADTRLRARWL
jgi:aryl-alcohol dehydrogenase-like predicted oxidoreductase